LGTVLAPIQIGIDIGKITDPTALSIAEAVQINTGRFRACKRVSAHVNLKTGEFVPPKDAEPVLQTRFIVRQIGRMPLGTSYPDVAEKIVDILLSDKFEGRQIRLLVDVTGVGQAIYDMIRREIYERTHEAIRTYREDIEEGAIKQRILDMLRLPRPALTPEQKERLKRVSLQPISFVHGEKYNRSKGTLGKAFLVSKMQAHLQYGRVDLPNTPEAKATCDELLVYEIKISEKGTDTYGAKTGKHDDLATALALSCLEDPYAERVSYSERVH
jgi:hypothetical protein